MTIARPFPTPALLRHQPVVAYTRKSSEGRDEQVHSLDRQREAITAFVAQHTLGEVDQWFEDEQSGKNFDRPGYDALLRFCETHPQPRSAPGKVLCLDYDRFSRSVDAQIKANPIEFQRQVIRLYDSGWDLDFVLTPKSGNSLLDGITATMKASMAGEYIEKLSHVVRSGKLKVGRLGNWIGGAAPFPAVRYNADDVRYERPLREKDGARNGMCVLGPDLGHPEKRQYWEEGARMLLGGATINDVARKYAEWGVAQLCAPRRNTAATSSWTATQIKRVYTNVALAGKVRYRFAKDGGDTLSYMGEARWEPIVDEQLFWQVQDVLAGRKQSKHARSAGESGYVLHDLYCYHCATRWVANTRFSNARETKGQAFRMYYHPAIGSRVGPEAVAKMREHGCIHWSLDAGEAENAIRDLILAQRASPDAYQAVLDLMDTQDARKRDAEAFEQSLRGNVQSLEAQKERLKKSLRFAETDAEREEIMQDIRHLLEQVTTGEAQIEQARLQTSQIKSQTTRLLSAYDEARTLLGAWDLPGDDGFRARQRLIDFWIAAVFVEVERRPEQPRAGRRILHVFLNTDPSVVTKLPLDYRKGGPAKNTWESQSSQRTIPPCVEGLGVTAFRIVLLYPRLPRAWDRRGNRGRFRGQVS